MTDYRGSKVFTARGLRNNNPFNLQKTAIKWQGKIPGNDSRFETFDSVENGIRAGVIDVVGDIAKDGDNTLNKLFKRFAPEFENDTAAYIKYVGGVTGKTADEVLNPGGKIDRIFLYKLATAIIEKENGKEQAKNVPAEVIKNGVDLALKSSAISKYIQQSQTPTGSKSGTLKDYSGLIILAIMFILFFKFFIQLK